MFSPESICHREVFALIDAIEFLLVLCVVFLFHPFIVVLKEESENNNGLLVE